MASSPDLLTEIRGELDARLRELRPLLAEYERLLSASDVLASDETTPRTRRRAVRDTPARARAKAPSRARVKAPARARVSAPAGASTPVSDPAPAGASSPAGAPSPVSVAPRRRSGAPKRAQRGAAAVAIVAALEHGSHTVAELAIVTAMSGSVINNNLRRLQRAGTVGRTKREGDGKAAYALGAAPA